MKLFAQLTPLFGFLWKKKLLTLIGIALVGFGYWYFFASATSTKTTYQTAVVEKGTLIVSVSASGQVSAANSTSVNTTMTGVVKTLFVKNGDIVKAGDKIAELDLDQSSLQKQQAAYASYLSAKTALDNANAQMYTLQSKMFAANQTFVNGKGTSDPVKDDPTYVQQSADWQASEANYKNQQAVIAQAQTALSSASLTYQQSSAIITAPIAGTVTGLSLQEGTVLSSSTTTSSSSTSNSSSNVSSSQKIATIKTEGLPSISVNLSEVDAPKITIGNKATITLDALTGKTFTGKVVSLDTTGSVSSNVTTYPAVIVLDSATSQIFPNMTATANIIVDTKDDVLLVPNAAVQTASGESTIQVMKNGSPTTVTVTVGSSNDTQTEISTGVSEGDTVVTGTISAATTTSSSTTSPFSTRGGFGGGTAVRVSR